MASLVIWSDPETGVTAEWNKQAAPTLTVPERPGSPATRRPYQSQEAATRAAKRAARQIKAQA